MARRKRKRRFRGKQDGEKVIVVSEESRKKEKRRIREKRVVGKGREASEESG